MVKAAPMPRYIEPQLCTLVQKPPAGDEWAHEIKWDGYRVTTRLDAGKARVFTRNGHDWTERFPVIAAEVARLGAKRAYLDGELCALNNKGVSDFGALQAAIGSHDNGHLIYFVFDLLFLDAEDIRPRSLIERRGLLTKLLGGRGKAKWSHIKMSETVEASGPDFFRHACQHGLEGIISKRRDAPYRSGRTLTWVKVKCSPRQELVIGGYTISKKTGGLGSLLLGHYEDGKLVYDGRVGTGFSVKFASDLLKRLKEMRVTTSKMIGVPRERAREGVWVRPSLVCEVKFTARTSEGYLRQASFLGLREDKPARKVTKLA